MKWLETNFKELLTDVPNIIKEQYTQAFILRLIGGILMPDKSQNLVHIRLSDATFWVEATNSTVVERHESTAQVGYDEILIHMQTLFLIRHDNQFGVQALVQSYRQAISAIGECEDTTLCTTTSLFYRGGSSAQPLYHKVKDTQWEARTTPHSSTKESDGYEDEDDDRYEDEYEGGVKMKKMITINN
ncbi:hypothetical protein Gotur_018343 [Gossypium turneri]